MFLASIKESQAEMRNQGGDTAVPEKKRRLGKQTGLLLCSVWYNRVTQSAATVHVGDAVAVAVVNLLFCCSCCSCCCVYTIDAHDHFIAAACPPTQHEVLRSLRELLLAEHGLSAYDLDRTYTTAPQLLRKARASSASQPVQEAVRLPSGMGQECCTIGVSDLHAVDAS